MSTTKTAVPVLLLLALLHTAHAATVTLHGKWNQLFSNLYVYRTSEVDWKCVRVFVDVNGSTMSFYKRASLHGGPVDVTTPVLHTTLMNDKFAVPTSFRSSITFNVHPYNNHTVIVTGEEVPALYAWVRPDAVDRDNDDDQVLDVPRLLAFVKHIGFASRDPSDDVLVETYDRKACA